MEQKGVEKSSGSLMTCRLFAVLILVCEHLPYASAQTAADMQTLRNVQVLFRHGDRNPGADDFPTNPYGSDSPVWLNGPFQLTQLGMRQCRDLGKLLRSRYEGFLNRTYITKELYVRSTDRDRALMSASSLLAGLYPPKGFQQWDKDINWQPIPVHTVRWEEDWVLTTDTECPRYNELYAQSLNSSAAEQLRNEHAELFKYVGENAGWGPTPTLNNMFDMYDPLHIMRVHNYSWPAWMSEDVYQELEDVYYKEADFDFFTPEMLYLKIGGAMQVITKRLQERNTQKMVLYSTHDTTLSGVLKATDLWFGEIIDYAGAVLIEQHDQPETNSSFVRIYLKNDTHINSMAPPIELTMPGCAFDCPLDDFLTLVRPFTFQGTYQNFLAECNDVKGMADDMLIVTVVAMMCVIVFLAILCYCMLCRKTRNTKEYEHISTKNEENYSTMNKQ